MSRVIDGDTIELTTGVKIRYIGINTPETKHPTKPVEEFGAEAAAANKKLVEGKLVKLEFDIEKKDKYGRVLAYVYVDTIFVNAWLVENGFAQVATYPPNVRYQDIFIKLEKKARETKKGLWASAKKPEKPSPIKVTNSVYVTRTGAKYHRGHCRYLSKSKIPIDLESAVASYGPCSVCKPPVLIGRKVKSTPKKSISSGRCQATTKKSRQCKRKAQAGRSYCWQH